MWEKYNRAEIAFVMGISVSKVGNLLNGKRPVVVVHDGGKTRQQMKQEKFVRIRDFVLELAEGSSKFLTLQKIVLEVKDKLQEKTSKYTVAKILKEDGNYCYVKSRPKHPNYFSDAVILGRFLQLRAVAKAILSEYVVVNLDESHF